MIDKHCTPAHVFCVSSNPAFPPRAGKPPSGANWIHEIKHDGYRLMVRRDPVGIRPITRRGNDWTDRFPLVIEAVNYLNHSTLDRGSPVGVPIQIGCPARVETLRRELLHSLGRGGRKLQGHDGVIGFHPHLGAGRRSLSLLQLLETVGRDSPRSTRGGSLYSR